MAKNNNNQLSPILIGLMGSGKSSIGRRLAKRFGITLIDLDNYIVEKAGNCFRYIFVDVFFVGFVVIVW